MKSIVATHGSSKKMAVARAVVIVASSPFKIWTIGRYLGPSLGLIMCAGLLVNLFAFDVIPVPEVPQFMRPTGAIPYTPAFKNPTVELAKIHADRDVKIERAKAWGAAIGRWGHSFGILVLLVVLMVGLWWTIKTQTLDEQRMDRERNR